MLHVNTFSQLQETFWPKRNQAYKTPNGFVYITYGKDKRRAFIYRDSYNNKYYIKIVTKEGEKERVLSTKGDCLVEISKSGLFKKEKNLIQPKLNIMSDLNPNKENLQRECRSILNEIELFLEDLENEPKELQLFTKAKKLIEGSKYNK